VSTLSSALRRAARPARALLVRQVDQLALKRYRTLAKRGQRGRDPQAVDRETVAAFRALTRRKLPAQARAEVEDAVLDGFRRLSDGDIDGSRPCAAARQTLVDQFHRLYYHSAKAPWRYTSFAGVRALKNPADLWLYQEILTEVRPDVIIEAGTKYGGSAYYLASMLDLLGHGHVITIDVKELPGRPEHPRITYLTGSSTDPAVVDHVDKIVDGARTLVILDSDHRRHHVLNELRVWHSRVPVGSYVIVEDSNINGHPVARNWGPGPMEALEEFLSENDQFVVDESKHKYFVTFNPRGYLKRVS
jgi:cephalosporin hydroxylase